MKTLHRFAKLMTIFTVFFFCRWAVERKSIEKSRTFMLFSPISWCWIYGRKVKMRIFWKKYRIVHIHRLEKSRKIGGTDAPMTEAKDEPRATANERNWGKFRAVEAQGAQEWRRMRVSDKRQPMGRKLLSKTRRRQTKKVQCLCKDKRIMRGSTR